MAKDGIIEQSDGKVVYLERHQAIVSFNGSPSAKGSPTTLSSVNDPKGMGLIPWGDDNDYPRRIYKLCEKNSIIPSTLDWASRAIICGGFVYGEEIIENRKKVFVPQIIDEVEEFIELNNLSKYFQESTLDFLWFNHGWSEMGLLPDRSKFVSLLYQESINCRFGEQDENNKVNEVLINANFPIQGAKQSTSRTMIDPYWDPVTTVRNDKAYWYIYPTSYSSPGKVHYQQPAWHSVVLGWWVNVANLIPQFKEYLMRNSMTVKYIFHVPLEWWSWRFPGWDDLPEADKETSRQAVKKEFNDVLTGVENAGKAIIATFKTDAARQEFTKWELQVVDDNMKDGKYIEDSQEASSHILYALSVDGTLIGNSPGKQMGAGSGSDKKAAWNNNAFVQTPRQDGIMEPLNFISKYNQWKGENKRTIKWKFENILVAAAESLGQNQTQASQTN